MPVLLHLLAVAASFGPIDQKVSPNPKLERTKFSVKIDVPVTSQPLMNAVSAEVNRDVRRLRAQAVRVEQEDKKSGWKSTVPNEVLVEGESTFENQNLLSYRWMMYAYFGGAHGSTAFRSATYELQNGKPVRIPLSKLFQPGFDYRSEIGRILWRKLSIQNQSDWIDEGTVLPEKLADMASWNLVDGALEFQFNHYDVTSYAAGTPAVTIPFSEIQGLRPSSVVRYAWK